MEIIDSPPSEFSRLAHCFLQDDYSWGISNLSGWAERAIVLSHLPPKSVQTLMDFIDGLLSRKDDKYIEEVWRQFGGGFILRGGGAMREFMTTLRQLLDSVEIKSLGS